MQKIAELIHPLLRGLEFLAPIGDLLLRIWVSWVFLKSGMNKWESWDTTLMLFEYEYSVPILPPDIAAYAGTATELIFPVLLIVGFFGRASAGILFVFNIIAVISYPSLNEAGQLQHYMWGIMLLIPFLRGPGALSVDHFIRRKYLG